MKHNWLWCFRTLSEMQSNTEVLRLLASTSRPKETGGTDGFFPFETMAWGSTPSISKGYLSSFRDCMGEMSSRAPGLDWQFAKRSWNDGEGEYGSSQNRK